MSKVKVTLIEGRKLLDPEIALKFAEAVTGKKPTAQEIAYAQKKLGATSLKDEKQRAGRVIK